MYILFLKIKRKLYFTLIIILTKINLTNYITFISLVKIYKIQT